MFTADFQRRSPRSIARQMDVPPGWFVVSYRWIETHEARRRLHGRWCRIKSPHKRIYRILSFSGNLEGSPRSGSGTIILDWPGWLDLSDRIGQTPEALSLSIRPARCWEYPLIIFTHPDPTYRLNGALGWLSAILGILSLILAGI